MSVPTINPNYVDEFFIAEAEQVAGSMQLMGGSGKLGFKDARDRDQIAKFMAHLSPTGERLMRWQANSPDWLYCPIVSVSASVNAWLKTQPLEGFSKFMTEVMKPAVELYFQTMQSRCYVRETIDGVKQSTKADLVGLTAIHAFARDGNLSVHAHVAFWRFGLTERGAVKSFEDRRFVPRMMGISSEVAQLAIAVGIEERFAVETKIIDGKCEVVGLSKQALDSVGTRRKEMLEYLKANGIKPTPQAMAYAAINTRTEKKAYKLSERLETWNQQAGKVDLGGVKSPDPSAWGSRLKALIDEFIIQPGKVIGTAYRLTWGKHPGTVKVRDVAALLEDTRVRTRREGHKAAIRALIRTNLTGLHHALVVAEQGFRKGRKPITQLPKGTRVVVSEKAAREATPKQLEELRQRAVAKGWKLRIGGQQLNDGLHRSGM